MDRIQNSACTLRLVDNLRSVWPKIRPICWLTTSTVCFKQSQARYEPTKADRIPDTTTVTITTTTTRRRMITNRPRKTVVRRYSYGFLRSSEIHDFFWFFCSLLSLWHCATSPQDFFASRYRFEDGFEFEFDTVLSENGVEQVFIVTGDNNSGSQAVSEHLDLYTIFRGVFFPIDGGLGR